MLSFRFHYMGSTLLATLCVWFHSLCQTRTVFSFLLLDLQWMHVCRTSFSNSLTTTITRLPFSARLIFQLVPFFRILSEVIKTDVTRSESIVEDAERAPTLFENFKIPLARFGSFVFLSFYIICLEDFLSASASKSMHASSSTHKGELLGWIAGSFSEHNSGISVSPDVGLLESSGVHKLLQKERGSDLSIAIQANFWRTAGWQTGARFADPNTYWCLQGLSSFSYSQLQVPIIIVMSTVYLKIKYIKWTAYFLCAQIVYL